MVPMVYTNTVQGSTSGTVGNTIGTNGNANGTIGSPNCTIGVICRPMVPLVSPCYHWLPMVPLVKLPMMIVLLLVLRNTILNPDY